MTPDNYDYSKIHNELCTVLGLKGLNLHVEFVPIPSDAYNSSIFSSMLNSPPLSSSIRYGLILNFSVEVTFNPCEPKYIQYKLIRSFEDKIKHLLMKVEGKSLYREEEPHSYGHYHFTRITYKLKVGDHENFISALHKLALSTADAEFQEVLEDTIVS